MDARTELGVWRASSLIVAFGCGIAAFIVGGAGGVLLSFIGLFASFMASMVFEKGKRGWVWAAVVLNGVAVIVAGYALGSGS